MKAVVGIDPGATGAAAVLDLDSSLLLIYADPGGREIPAHARAQWLEESLRPYPTTSITVAIEAPPMGWRGSPDAPHAGASTSSMAKLNRNAGVWEGIAAAMGLSYSYVAAISWKSAMGLKGKEKGDSLIVARREFPWAASYFAYKTKDVGKADAALIALYAARRLRLT